MKRRDLIKKFENNGWWLLRHGSKHDIYTNGERQESVSHTREIGERLAKTMLKRNGIN